MQHEIEYLWLPEAAVEPVAEFCQIAGQTLGADTVMHAPDIAFDIADQGMESGQDLHRLFSRTGWK
jgi:hypothetical protein